MSARSRTGRGRRQGGFVVSTELIFLVTVVVLGLLTGWVMVRDNVAAELQDVANAIGALNQSYTFNGLVENQNAENTITMGSRWVDGADESDGAAIGQIGPLEVFAPPAGGAFPGPPDPPALP